MTWSDRIRSSESPSSQREELRPSRRTCLRGHAASTLAGIQAIEVQGSELSSCHSI